MAENLTLENLTVNEGLLVKELITTDVLVVKKIKASKSIKTDHLKVGHIHYEDDYPIVNGQLLASDTDGRTYWSNNVGTGVTGTPYQIDVVLTPNLFTISIDPNATLGYLGITGSLIPNRGVTSNIAIGNQSLFGNTAGINNVAIGDDALYNNTHSNNIAIGTQSLYNDISGINNIALGTQSLYNNISGQSNIAIGKSSMLTNNSFSHNIGIGEQTLEYFNGNDNIAIGYQSMLGTAGSTGIYNTCVGNYTMMNNVGGSNNTVFGTGSLLNNTVGNNNVAIGYQSMLSNDANNNIGIGNGSGYSNTSGTSNVAIGVQSLYNNQGSHNTAIGEKAMKFNNGTENIAIGYNSNMGSSSTGNFNTTVGNYSLNVNTTGSSNVVIGANSLLNNTTGSYNVVIGNQSYNNNTIGNNNIVIGSTAGSNVGATSNNCIYIGDNGNALDTDYTYRFGIQQNISTGLTFQVNKLQTSITVPSTSFRYSKINGNINLTLTTPIQSNTFTGTGFTFGLDNILLITSSVDPNICPDSTISQSCATMSIFINNGITSAYLEPCCMYINYAGLLTINIKQNIPYGGSFIIPPQTITYPVNSY